MGNIIWSFRYSIKCKKIISYIIAFSLFLYVFSLPSFSRQSSNGLIFYIPYFFMFLLGLFTFFYTILYNKNNIKLKWNLLFLPFFVLIAFISTCIYSNQFRELLTLFLLMITTFIFYFSMFCFKDFKSVLNIILLALLGFCLYFIIHYKSDILKFFNGSISRLGDYFDNVNHIGEYMSLGFVISLFMFLFTKNKRFLFYLIPILMFIFVGILTGSRSFIILLAITSIVLIFMRFWKHKFKLLIIIVSLVAIFVVLINLPFMAFLKQQFINVINTIFNGGNNVDHSFMERFLWQKYALELGSKNVIFGYGCSGFAIYSGVGTFSHGNFAECICNFGLLGTVCFYGFIISSFFFALKLKDKYKYLVFIIVIYYIIDSVLIVYLTNKSVYLAFACAHYITNNKNRYFNDKLLENNFFKQKNVI